MKLRQLLLLLASTVFYMYFIPKYILILLLVILIDYFSALKITAASTQTLKKTWLTVSIVSNLSILFFFKYFNFFIENINAFGHLQFTTLSIILPIGLSFHTFQSLSYTIEVYRGGQEAEKNFHTFALYVLFFPQLVAGPIERPQNILPQLKLLHTFSFRNFAHGMKHIAIGLLMKSVLADRLAIYVDNIYGGTSHTESQVALALLFFSFQIYFDFAGYSLIAIGSAKCFGITLMDNFNAPYFSKNIREFWNRWHISLSTWFRDYVYIPLGGRSNNYFLLFRNLFFVFTLSGLWHGASWNFVVWGIAHCLFVFASHVFNFSFTKIHPSLIVLDILLNFIIVSLLWNFFRAESLDQAVTVYYEIAHLKFHQILPLLPINDFGEFSLTVLIAGGAFLTLARIAYSKVEKLELIFPSLLITSFCMLFLLLFGVFNRQSFIYFQF